MELGYSLTDEEDAEVASPNIQSKKAPLLRPTRERVDVRDKHLHWHIIPLPLQTPLEGRSESTLHLLPLPPHTPGTDISTRLQRLSIQKRREEEEHLQENRERHRKVSKKWRMCVWGV